MDYIPWSDAFGVYNSFIDSQHKDLVDRVNKLYTAARGETDSATLMSMLDELIKATRTHFNTEEVLMQATGYKGIEVHRREHNDHLADIEHSRIILQRTGGTTGGLFLILRSIVVDHMQTTDYEFGQFLKQFLLENPDAPLPFSDEPESDQSGQQDT